MKESFRNYNDSAILNRVLEFPVTLVVTETHVFMYVLESISCKNDVTLFMYVLESISCKNDVTLFIVNVTRLYVIDDVMKIKLATE